MPVYSIQTPGGKTLDIEAADEGTALRGAQEWHAQQGVSRPLPRQPAPPQAISPALAAARAHDAKLDARDGARSRDAARANMQGYSFGVSDELLGARDAAGAAIKGLLRQSQGASPKQAYDARMQQEADRLAAYRKGHALRAGGAELIGALANPVNFVGGEVINGARTVGGQVARAGVLGGATGAAYGAGAGSGVKGRLKGAATGGATGAALGAGLQGAGALLARSGARAATAAPSPARALANEGVQLTPGQMMGGMAQRAEDAATSIPILGDSIRGARIRGLESFNRTAVNRALQPIGAQLAPDVNMGRDGLRAASDAISQTYEQALTPVTVQADPQFVADLAAIEARPNLPQTVRDELNTALGDTLDRLANPVSGQDWKLLDADLGSAARAADTGTAGTPSLSRLRDALQDARAAGQRLLERTDPNAHAAVRQADEATANLMRIRKAAQSTGARNGVFTPGHLSGAVRSADSSGGKRAFAQGDALMQDLSDRAQEVLPSTVPDSGTPFRSLLSIGGLSGGGVAIGADPAAVAAGVGGLLGGSAIYSQPAQAAINAVYRAATPGAARTALGRLSQLAAREPGLQSLVEQFRARLDGPANARSTQPQGLLTAPQR